VIVGASAAPASAGPSGIVPSTSAVPSAAGSPPVASVGPSVGPSVLPGGSGGTATIGIPALSLSIRLPAGWVGLDATVPVSIIETTSTRFPDLTEPLARLRAAELGFVAYDAASTSHPTSSLTIATTGDPIPVASLLDALARQTAEQLAKTQTITDVQHESATLAAGPAAELRYRTVAKGSGLPVAVDAWFVSTAGHTFLLTFSVPAAEADTLRPAIHAAADSLSGG